LDGSLNQQKNGSLVAKMSCGKKGERITYDQRMLHVIAKGWDKNGQKREGGTADPRGYERQRRKRLLLWKHLAAAVLGLDGKKGGKGQMIRPANRTRPAHQDPKKKNKGNWVALTTPGKWFISV